jgi:hypothetical protein
MERQTAGKYYRSRYGRSEIGDEPDYVDKLKRGEQIFARDELVSHAIVKWKR